MTELHLTEPADLVSFAFADTSSDADVVQRHLADCAGCRTVVERLRGQANALRLVGRVVEHSVQGCLDAESIAAFAEGSIQAADRAAAIAHLLGCAHCCQEVASVARLLDAPDVTDAIERLEKPAGHGYPRKRIVGVAAVGALAAGLLFLLLPISLKVAKPRYREESVTGAAAPRLVAPLAAGAPSNAFRWTSVPRADRYRITVFARDGAVLWEAQTRDTAIAFPEVARRAPNDTILWRVEAHVGWEDRWAASPLAILSLDRVPK